MENNLKHNLMSAEDLGMTEDEYSNYLIDWYQAIKGIEESTKDAKWVPVFPERITITIRAEDHFTNESSRN